MASTKKAECRWGGPATRGPLGSPRLRALLLLTAVLTGSVARGQDDVVKRALRAPEGSPNLLASDRWRPWGKGFARRGGAFECDNGTDESVQRGLSQSVELDQEVPTPIVASAWSRAEAVGGAPDADYSIYLDLLYTDGTPLWGQTASFAVGNHGWQRRRVLVVPAKPVRRVTMHLLLRRHRGRVSFRDPTLSQIEVPAGAVSFDGVPVELREVAPEGTQLRDVAAESDFVRPRSGRALGLSVRQEEHRGAAGARFVDIEVEERRGIDRAITVVYSRSLPAGACRWLEDPRRTRPVAPGREYLLTSGFRAGANGRLSRYPLGAVEASGRGLALGIDMERPAFFRIGVNAGTRELFVAFDVGLTAERPRARLRVCAFEFDPEWAFRAALARYQEIFPEHFRCRVPRPGLWMPFAPIREVRRWQDFGFRFKEGDGETEWDDAHDIITFRYTEPMTWWMKLPPETPRTLDAALARVERLAQGGPSELRQRAKALLTSGFHDQQGRYIGLFRNEPWCRGIVWSVNSMPAISGEVTDFSLEWGPEVRAARYGPDQRGTLDGEYVDSSEGYVTAQLDFRREHFGSARTPLTFSWEDRRPAIFRGLIAYEYVRELSRDVHAMGKLMMANATPTRLPWLAPWLDVMGTETNWNPGGKWRPMSDADLLYRRALCGPKPYCFLMNTDFTKLSHALVEKYMKRAVAYGMFPGFFSANASTGQYFRRPELYERDRPLFLRYVPVCRRLAEAGWRPVTRARSSLPRVHLERFGERYLSVLNDSARPADVEIRLERKPPGPARELLSRRVVRWTEASLAGASGRTRRAGASVRLKLAAEDLAVLDLRADP